MGLTTGLNARRNNLSRLVASLEREVKASAKTASVHTTIDINRSTAIAAVAIWVAPSFQNERK